MKQHTRIVIVRTDTGPEGTFGRMILPGGRDLVCAELPWRDNRTSKSCIPPGTYACSIETSPTYGVCPHVHDVPGRTAILIHPGNWAGDVDAGLHSDSEGCILPGKGVGHYPPKGFASQRMVSNSQRAWELIMDELKTSGIEAGDHFELQILDATGEAGRGWNDGIR
jgi:hypothetical protein